MLVDRMILTIEISLTGRLKALSKSKISAARHRRPSIGTITVLIKLAIHCLRMSDLPNCTPGNTRIFHGLNTQHST